MTFVQPSGKSADIVFCNDVFTKTIKPEFDPLTNIRLVAKHLKDDILAYCNTIPEHSWPPTIETLTREYGTPPDSVRIFLTHLLTSGKHDTNTREKTKRLIDSLTADFVFNVSDGRVITPKHYLFALGLHNMTGHKQPVVITNKLGHCISYDLSCEIETALSEASLIRIQETSILPIKPTGNETIVTVFWVDNFDVKVERQSGGGSVNTTHLMAFQERNGRCIDYSSVAISRTKKRKFTSEEIHSIPTFNIDASIEPPTLGSMSTSESPCFDSSEFNCSLFIWVYLRKTNSFDQAVPNFPGWLLKIRKKVEPQISLDKTQETYLPPITTKVTEFQTISKYMSYLKSLAATANMPYVNISLVQHG